MNAALFPDLVVNGETVPHARVAAEAQNQSAPAGKPGIAYRKAANAIAIRTLLLQEAARQGVESDPAEITPGRFETKEEALIRGLLDTNLEPAAPSDSDIKAIWEKDPSRFLSPPLWEASHILVACPAGQDDLVETALGRAIELTQQAQDNPDGFARLAKKESECQSRGDGGFLGQLRPGDTVPEFEAALVALSEGQITSNPVRTIFGFHIIRLDAEAPRHELPFEAVKHQISEAMEKAAWAKAARAFVNQLVAAAEISGAELESNLPGTADHEKTNSNRASQH